MSANGSKRPARVRLQLQASFRATETLQRAINAAFAPIMTNDPATLQAAYMPLQKVRDDLPGQPSVVVLPVPRPYGRSKQVAAYAIEESFPALSAPSSRGW